MNLTHYTKSNIERQDFFCILPLGKHDHVIDEGDKTRTVNISSPNPPAQKREAELRMAYMMKALALKLVMAVQVEQGPSRKAKSYKSKKSFKDGNWSLAVVTRNHPLS